MGKWYLQGLHLHRSRKYALFLPDQLLTCLIAFFPKSSGESKLRKECIEDRKKLCVQKVLQFGNQGPSDEAFHPVQGHLASNMGPPWISKTLLGSFREGKSWVWSLERSIEKNRGGGQCSCWSVPVVGKTWHIFH